MLGTRGQSIEPNPSLPSLLPPPWTRHKHTVVQFTREQLLALRRPSRLPAEMADVPGIISAEPLEPVWSGNGALDADEASKHWARLRGPCRAVPWGVLWGEKMDGCLGGGRR